MNKWDGRRRDREELREKLKGEVRRLEIELEKTKTGQQLDSDKLDFNVDVLTKLSESEESIKKQKRRIQKGKEGLTSKLEERQQAKTKGIRLNDQLEADCERIEKQSSGLSDKLERFKSGLLSTNGGLSNEYFEGEILLGQKSLLLITPKIYYIEEKLLAHVISLRCLRVNRFRRNVCLGG